MVNVLMRIILKEETGGLIKSGGTLIWVFEKTINLPYPPTKGMGIKWKYPFRFDDGDNDVAAGNPDNWIFQFTVEGLIYNITTDTYECIETRNRFHKGIYQAAGYLKHVGFSEVAQRRL